MRYNEIAENLRSDVQFISETRDELTKYGVSNPTAITLARASLEFAKASARVDIPWGPDATAGLFPILARLLARTHVINQSAVLFDSPARLDRLPENPPQWPMHKLEGELAVQFLQRVWGPNMIKGSVYLDDLVRLGQRRLITDVTAYCRHYEIDASLVLPLSRKDRLKRFNEVIAPRSLVEAFLAQVLKREKPRETFMLADPRKQGRRPKRL